MTLSYNGLCRGLSLLKSTRGTISLFEPRASHDPPNGFYYKEGGTLLHKSMAIISDEPSHNALTIFAILQKTMPYVKSNVEDLDEVHYWTDSPTSQYRNTTIFSIVSITRNISRLNCLELFWSRTWQRAMRWHCWYRKATCRWGSKAWESQHSRCLCLYDMGREHQQERTIKFLFVDKKKT